MGFPDSSVGKETSCNAGNPGSIPRSRRSAGEGLGYPLQFSWASLVAQLVKNLPAMWETWVRSLDWEDALEKGKATHSSILAWRIPWTVSSFGLFALYLTLWTVALPGSSVHGDSPGKNTGLSNLSLLQGTVPTQGSNPGLLHCRWIFTS